MFNDSTIDFQTKVLARSGLGDETYLPPCAFPLLVCAVLGDWGGCLLGCCLCVEV